MLNFIIYVKFHLLFIVCTILWVEAVAALWWLGWRELWWLGWREERKNKYLNEDIMMACIILHNMIIEDERHLNGAEGLIMSNLMELPMT